MMEVFLKNVYPHFTLLIQLFLEAVVWKIFLQRFRTFSRTLLPKIFKATKFGQLSSYVPHYFGFSDDNQKETTNKHYDLVYFIHPLKFLIFLFFTFSCLNFPLFHFLLLINNISFFLLTSVFAAWINRRFVNLTH